MNTVQWTGINWTRFNKPEHPNSTYVCIYKCMIHLMGVLQHIHFYVSTQPEYSFAHPINESTWSSYSCASMTPQFLHITSTKIFFRISITMYLINQNILACGWHFHFNISTEPKYSFASLTSPFLRVYLTKIFFRIPDTSISMYILDQIFFCILDITISTCQLDQNILVHPWHLHFYVCTQANYSFASSTSPFLHVYSTKIIFRIPDTSISTYLLNQCILSHPQHLHFYVSTWTK